MSRLRPILVVTAWIALMLLVALGIADAVLAPAPSPKQPDFIDTILASRAVVVAIRIAIIFAVVFVVLSVIVLIARRQWLTRVGPVEVSGRVSDLDAGTLRLEERLDDAYQSIESLEANAAYAQQLIDQKRDI
jgi:hypothetical protein